MAKPTMTRRSWSAAEDEYIRTHIGVEFFSTMAIALNRTHNAVKYRAAMLGVRRYSTAPHPARFWELVIKTEGCWWWMGNHTSEGYGSYWRNGRQLLAHRLAYKMEIGPIPEGLVLDHLCRNPSCVNPAHLQPVTQRINTRRGIGPTAINAAKTHCYRGHEFNALNTYTDKTGRRHCRPCQNLRNRARRSALLDSEVAR